MRILVVDDDSMTRRWVSRCLIKSGFEVLEAADGDSALELFRQRSAQLVVSDWMMPGMDGPEFCRKIRRDGRGEYVYFILLTQKEDSGSAADGLASGADDFLTKPFDPNELIMRVRTGERLLGLQSRDLTIFSLAKLAESRDPETGAHLERVQSYCRTLAEHLREDERFKDRIGEEFVRLIYETSPLHDIGKVAIPDSILLKPGKLTDAEFEQIKAHTVHGAETLEASLRQFPNARFLKMARDIALTHHERYDGGGYPKGLEGDAIPLEGRIMALADVYDALTSKRVYKEAHSHETARKTILEDAGAHFDPDVVEAFTGCEEAFLRIRDAHVEEPAQAP